MLVLFQMRHGSFTKQRSNALHISNKFLIGSIPVIRCKLKFHI